MAKVKVAILYDTEDWAYHIESTGMKKYLDLGNYNISSELFRYRKFYANKSIHKNFDKVFLFPRQASPMTFPAEKTIVRFSSFGNFSKQGSLNSTNFQNIVCMNKQIKDDALRMLKGQVDPSKIVHIRPCIDTDHFNINGRIPSAKRKGKLVVGFAGSHHRSKKGFDIMKRAEALFSNYATFKVATYNKSVNRIKYKDMPDFYNSLDLLICTSSVEGGPLTTFEAGGCGVPTILSCKKSAFWEATKDGVDCFKIDPDHVSLAEKIKYLSENRNLIDLASKEIKNNIINNYCWKSNIDMYAKLFLNN